MLQQPGIWIAVLKIRLKLINHGRVHHRNCIPSSNIEISTLRPQRHDSRIRTFVSFVLQSIHLGSDLKCLGIEVILLGSYKFVQSISPCETFQMIQVVFKVFKPALYLL